jgi:regulatory protein
MNRADRTTYDRALDMLESRARSVVELRRMLLRKGESANDVDAAIERLRGAGLLDDANYARQLARSKALDAGQSRRRIAQELMRKGVARPIADAAIADVFEEENVDEAAAIERVARKKMKSLSELDASTRRRRLYAFLARRGYDSEAIGQVVARLEAVKTSGQ